MSLASRLRPLLRRVPLVAALRGYGRADMRGDLSAGLTTAVMLIPQAMAYAMLAGLPPIVGLYASTLPLLAYALLGSARQLAVGPVAMDSLLVAAGVGALATAGTEHYITLAIALALLVGAIQVAMGLLRAGFLVNFLSQPVISGFTSAAALIIGLSQLQHLLGVPFENTQAVHEIVGQAVARIGEVEPVTLAIGLGSITTLVALQKKAPKVPRALAVVIVSTTLVWALSLHERGVAIVGQVPSGLPPLSWPSVAPGALLAMLPTAITIALIGFMEAISVARALARRTRHEVDANQELVALGAANVAAGVVGGYPVTGGFSRTAVNASAGARTPLSGVVTAAVIGLTLVLFTPLFYFLPKAVLAAVIMTAVFGLVDLREVRHLWRVDRTDLGLLVFTFAATLVAGIGLGILLGVGASLAVFVVRSTRPHAAVLGRIPGTTAYRNLERFGDARTIPGVVILRIDAQFYFGNVGFLKDTIARQLEQFEQHEGDLRAIVIDASGINRLDSSAEAALWDIDDDLRRRGIELHLAGVKGPVRDVMDRSGLVERLGPEHQHLTLHDAVCAADEHSHAHHAGEQS